MKIQLLLFVSFMSALFNTCHCKWEAFMNCGTWKMLGIRHTENGVTEAVTWSDQQNHESDMICSDDGEFCVYRVAHSADLCTSVGWRFQIKYHNAWAYDNSLTLSAMPSNSASTSRAKEFTLRFP